MVFDFTTFPIEIQETILSHLTGQSLIKVSKVCKLWRSICEWVAKEKFLKIVPKECIQEIENGGNTENIWLTATTNHFLQQYLVNNMLDHQKNIVVELDVTKHLCFCLFGPLVIVGCNSGRIEVYHPEQGDAPVLTITILEQPISQLEVMTFHNVLLVKAGRNDLEFLSLPYFSGKSWVYKMTRLKPIFSNYSNDLHCERNFSISNGLLATVTSSREISVFQVKPITKRAIELKFFSNYIADEAVGYISIWQTEVIVLFKSGEVLRWCLSNQTSTLSDRYHEIHYENPVWIYRGRIFCSTFISSQLLGYWHMNRGTDYWLIGRPASDLVRCRDLGTMFSADTSVENVLCVCLKQRLLACGTKDGKILLYYLSDKFFSSDEFSLNGNEHIKNEFNRVPDLTIRTTERPIKHIQMQFCEDSVRIYTWPYMLKNGPASKGILQCIILKEGDWVEEKDKESLDI